MSKSNIGGQIITKILGALQPPKKDKWALVLEGGAMRSIFTAGVLMISGNAHHEAFGYPYRHTGGAPPLRGSGRANARAFGVS